MRWYIVRNNSIINENENKVKIRNTLKKLFLGKRSCDQVALFESTMMKKNDAAEYVKQIAEEQKKNFILAHYVDNNLIELRYFCTEAMRENGIIETKKKITLA